MNINRILVATDLSEASENALRCAVNLAKKFKSEIVLLHIFEVPDIDENAKRIISSSFLNRDIKRQLQEAVQEVEKNEGLKISFLTKDGDLFNSMSDAALETKSDVLMVGTHGVHGIQHLTGSFIAQTVNCTPIPVWVVQKDSQIIPYQNILVLIDELLDNPLHHFILNMALAFESKIHFVFTTTPNEFSVSNMLEKMKNILGDKGIQYTINFIADHPDKPKSLLEIARDCPAPLIILDRNGKDASGFVPIFTNKHSIEVLCLNSSNH